MDHTKKPFFTWVDEHYNHPTDVPPRIREHMRVLWLDGAKAWTLAELFHVPLEWVDMFVREPTPPPDRPHYKISLLYTHVTLAAYGSSMWSETHPRWLLFAGEVVISAEEVNREHRRKMSVEVKGLAEIVRTGAPWRSPRRL